MVDIYHFNCSLFTFFFKKNTGILGYLVIEYLRQVAKLKRTWNLAPVSQIVQKITENYCTCLYLSAGQVGDSMICGSNDILNLVSCTNTHCDITDLVNHGMFKNAKT